MTREFEGTASEKMQKLIDAGWRGDNVPFTAVQILCRELRSLGRGDLVDLFNKVAKQNLEPFGDLEHLMEDSWGPLSAPDSAKIKAPLDRFDLEQDIFKCWHLVDDIDQVAELVLDRDASKDTVSNILIGLSALYGDRFQKLMANFEKLIANEKI